MSTRRHRFIIKEKALTLEDLDSLWAAQSGKHEAIVKNVHDLLAKLAWDFSPEQLDHLFGRFQVGLDRRSTLMSPGINVVVIALRNLVLWKALGMMFNAAALIGQCVCCRSAAASANHACYASSTIATFSVSVCRAAPVSAAPVGQCPVCVGRRRGPTPPRSSGSVCWS